MIFSAMQCNVMLFNAMQCNSMQCILTEFISKSVSASCVPTRQDHERKYSNSSCAISPRNSVMGTHINHSTVQPKCDMLQPNSDNNWMTAVISSCARLSHCFVSRGRIPYFQAKAKHLHTICTTSAQRLRRWSNIVQMLYKCFVFAGLVRK